MLSSCFKNESTIVVFLDDFSISSSSMLNRSSAFVPVFLETMKIRISERQLMKKPEELRGK